MRNWKVVTLVVLLLVLGASMVFYKPSKTENPPQLEKIYQEGQHVEALVVQAELNLKAVKGVGLQATFEQLRYKAVLLGLIYHMIDVMKTYNAEALLQTDTGTLPQALRIDQNRLVSN